MRSQDMGQQVVRSVQESVLEKLTPWNEEVQRMFARKME